MNKERLNLKQVALRKKGLLTKIPNNKEVRARLKNHPRCKQAKFARCKNVIFAINDSGVESKVYNSINAAKRISKNLSHELGTGINI